MLHRFAAVAFVLALVVPQAAAIEPCGAMVCCMPPAAGLAFDAPDCCAPEMAAETHDVPGEIAKNPGVNLHETSTLLLTPAPRHASSMTPLRRTAGPDEAPPPPTQRRLSTLSLLLI